MSCIAHIRRSYIALSSQDRSLYMRILAEYDKVKTLILAFDFDDWDPTSENS